MPPSPFFLILSPELQGEHKVFPWLQTFITRKLLHVEYKYIYIYIYISKCNSSFFTTHQYTSTCAPYVARRTSNRKSISLHVFSNISSVIVAKASVILAFRFVISGTGVENTLFLTYRNKKKSRGRGWYPAIVVARVSDHLSQSTSLEMLHPKTKCYKCYNEHMT